MRKASGLGRGLPRRSLRVYGGALAIVIAIALVAAFVSLRGQPAAQGESPSPTSGSGLSPLAKAMQGINADGTWSTETALAVFAAAFGPLPGVPAPAQDRSYHSGTAALQMVEAHWADLTAEQKQAVRDYVGPAAPAIVPAAYHPLFDTYQQPPIRRPRTSGRTSATRSVSPFGWRIRGRTSGPRGPGPMATSTRSRQVRIRPRASCRSRRRH